MVALPGGAYERLDGATLSLAEPESDAIAPVATSPAVNGVEETLEGCAWRGRTARRLPVEGISSFAKHACLTCTYNTVCDLSDGKLAFSIIKDNLSCFSISTSAKFSISVRS